MAPSTGAHLVAGQGGTEELDPTGFQLSRAQLEQLGTSVSQFVVRECVNSTTSCDLKSGFPPHPLSAAASEPVRAALRDERLQRLLMEIDGSRDPEGVGGQKKCCPMYSCLLRLYNMYNMVNCFDPILLSVGVGRHTLKRP